MEEILTGEVIQEIMTHLMPKEDIITILRSEGIDDSNYKITQDAPKYYHPGKSGGNKTGPNEHIRSFW